MGVGLTWCRHCAERTPQEVIEYQPNVEDGQLDGVPIEEENLESMDAIVCTECEQITRTWEKISRAR